MTSVETPGADGEIERVQGDGDDLEAAVALDFRNLGRPAELDDLRTAHHTMLRRHDPSQTFDHLEQQPGRQAVDRPPRE